MILNKAEFLEFSVNNEIVLKEKLSILSTWKTIKKMFPTTGWRKNFLAEQGFFIIDFDLSEEKIPGKNKLARILRIQIFTTGEAFRIWPLVEGRREKHEYENIKGFEEKHWQPS